MMSLKKLLCLGALLVAVAFVMNMDATSAEAGHYYRGFAPSCGYSYGYAPTYYAPTYYTPSYFTPSYHYGGYGCFGW